MQGRPNDSETLTKEVSEDTAAKRLESISPGVTTKVGSSRRHYATRTVQESERKRPRRVDSGNLLDGHVTEGQGSRSHHPYKMAMSWSSTTEPKLRYSEPHSSPHHRRSTWQTSEISHTQNSSPFHESQNRRYRERFEGYRQRKPLAQTIYPPTSCNAYYPTLRRTSCSYIMHQ